jgi:hypothetical protein
VPPLGTNGTSDPLFGWKKHPSRSFGMELFDGIRNFSDSKI